VFKSRKMRWAVAWVCETGKVYTLFWWRDLMEGDHLEDLHVGGRVILKWIFKTWDGEAWAGFLWPRTETGDGHL
jgi:hypothetical protein